MSKAQSIACGEVFRAHYGKALKAADRNEHGAYEVFGANGKIGHHDKELHEGPTIIIGRKGSVGHITYAPNGGWTIDTAFYVEILDERKCFLRYLYYALKGANLATKTITTSIPGLNRDELYRTQISLPPLDEQKRIAAILDKADAIRRKRRQAIELTDQLLRSVFLDMFGDPIENPYGFPVKPLIRLIESDRPITYGILKPGPDIPEGVPYVRVVDMRNRSVMTDVVRRTSNEIDNQYKRSRLKPGDILLSIRGHVGRLAMTPPELAGANITQDTARLAPGAAIHGSFLLHCLETVTMQRHMQRFVKGVAVTGINLGDVKELPIPVPPDHLQQRFAAARERVLKIEAAQRFSLSSSANLFAALAQEAFQVSSSDAGAA